MKKKVKPFWARGHSAQVPPHTCCPHSRAACLRGWVPYKENQVSQCRLYHTRVQGTPPSRPEKWPPSPVERGARHWPQPPSHMRTKSINQSKCTTKALLSARPGVHQTVLAACLPAAAWRHSSMTAPHGCALPRLPGPPCCSLHHACAARLRFADCASLCAGRPACEAVAAGCAAG